MPNRDETWAPVWAAVRARHEELGWTKEKLYEETGISEATFAKRWVDELPLKRRDKIAGLEDGLRWERGSVAAILAGGEPTVVEVSAGGEVSSPDDQRVERLEGRFDELLEILDEVLASDLSTMGQAWAERRRRVEGP